MNSRWDYGRKCSSSIIFYSRFKYSIFTSRFICNCLIVYELKTLMWWFAYTCNLWCKGSLWISFCWLDFYNAPFVQHNSDYPNISNKLYITPSFGFGFQLPYGIYPSSIIPSIYFCTHRFGWWLLSYPCK